MPNEFTMSNHSGNAPKDLRFTDPRPKTHDSCIEEEFRVALEAKGKHELACMLFDPIGAEGSTT